MKRILVPLLMVSVLLLLLVPGCGDKETAETTKPPVESSELTLAQMQEIFNDSAVAAQSAKSYKSDMNMTMRMEISGGAQPGKVNVVMTGTGVYDLENNNMQMNMDMDMEMDMETDMDMSEVEEAMQNISMEMYLLDGTVYMKMDMPIVGEQWMKMEYDEETMQAFNTDMVKDQLEMLKSAIDIEFLRNETVDVYNCYVFKFVPDMAKLMEWITQQQMPGAGFDQGSMPDMADMFKNISYVVWIDKDTNRIIKMDGSLTMEFNAEDLEAEPGEFDTMKMDMEMGMRLYDYGKLVTIVVPEEAKNAIEMPGAGF